MGIYDRDYYRKEGPSYLDRLVPSGAVCQWLIGINLAVFLIQVLLGKDSQLVNHFTLHSPSVYEGEIWRVFTYAFLHGDFMHIFFNMLFLWWFGSDLEEVCGPREFLAFYLGGVLAGAAGYMIHGAVDFWMRGVHPGSVYFAHCLGASGAVTATLLLYAIHFPSRTILVMLVLPVPVWFVVIFQVVKDAAGLFDTNNDVAVAGHLGGAAFAGLYYHFGWRITGFWRGLQNWWKQRSRPRLRIYQPEDKKEPVPVGARQGGEVDEHLEAKVDAVLGKVKRSGMESLTEQEKALLLRASEIYKKRRT